MSSGFNAMAASTLKDIVLPLHRRIHGKELGEAREAVVAKILGMRVCVRVGVCVCVSVCCLSVGLCARK